MKTAIKSNIYSLTEPGALSRIDLQNTIIDAMYACMKINHRYLWIDSLCIIQDDKDDLSEQIACMSDIYSGASLTIIAGWSDNADSGLPGVFQGPQRDPQYIAQVEGLEIVEVLPFLGKVINTRLGGLVLGRKLLYKHTDLALLATFANLIIVSRNGCCLNGASTSLMSKYTSNARLHCTTRIHGW